MRTRARLVAAIAAALTAALSITAGAVGQEFKQVPLTDQQVSAFIAAQADFAPLSTRLLEGGEKLDDALTKELEGIAKKHGFQSFAEFENVGTNITIILDGLDRSTGTFTDPIEKMKQELEDIKADSSIPDEDKKLAVDDLTQEIASAEPLKYKENVEVVKKHVDALEKLMPEEGGESLPPEPGDKAPE